jgi:Putative adhesin
MRLALVALAGWLAIVPVLPAEAQPAPGRDVPVAGASVLQIDIDGYKLAVKPDASAGAAAGTVLLQPGYDRSVPAPRIEIARVGPRLVVTILAPKLFDNPFAGSAPPPVFGITYPAHLRLEVRASGGGVQLAGTTAAAQVIDGGGDVAVDDPHGSIAVDNRDGNISVRGAHERVDVSSDSGSVAVDLAPEWSGDSVRMESADGNLTLHVAPGFRGDIDASTVAGTVRTALRSTAHAPPVWLFTRKGDISIGTASPAP